MRSWAYFKGLFVVIVVAGLATLMGMVIGSSTTSNNLNADDKTLATNSVNLLEPSTGHSPFVAIAQMVKPAVVNISAKSLVKDDVHDFLQDDFWRRFFGFPQDRQNDQQDQPRYRSSESLGSGFFINSDGYILTNNHVVRDADNIIVRLSDTKEFEATVVGTDSETDIAVLKIDSDEPMPYLEFGDSDSILVGDWAIAVGNPFPQLGLDRTVTVGVISALGRSGLVFGPDNPVYQNYIQTDASINPGNSGGPLIDIHGKVVGINSAIVSPSGGNIGIGFAVPINLAKKIAAELQESGSVSRGWLGILPNDIDNNMAEALDMDNTEGVLVESVEKDSPAEDGGLEVGDVIVELNGQKVTGAQQFRFLIADSGPGSKVEMKVIRNKKTKTLSFTLGDRSKFLTEASTENAPRQDKEWLGIQVETFTEDEARQMGIDFAPGALIASIEPGSPADDAGLFRGDIIQEIQHDTVENEADFLKAADKYKDRKKSILFLIQRGNRTIHKAVKP
jgi:serine protease Do